MIQATANRLEGLAPADHIFVLTGGAYAGLAAEQLPNVPPSQIIVEPSGRNTAPAIGLACVHLYKHDPTAVIAILPADHIIPHVDAFRAALRRAATVAREGYLVTLGILPNFPHTGYGYIKRKSLIDDVDGLPAFRVDRFLEKPNRSLAESFVAEGGYYWNGGIFISRVDRMMAEFETQTPAMYELLQHIGDTIGTPEADAVLAEEWEKMPSISIDYAIMERAQRVAVVPLDAGWNDVGSWDALDSVLNKDAAGNSIAKGDVLLLDSHDNIVYSDKRIVALVNVNNLVVVETADTLLIGDKGQMQRVKDVVEQLRAEGRTELL
jgi:mannose-1-phosphate guanylyltransferase